MSGLQLLLMVFVLAYIVFLLLREKIRADVEIARASAPPPPIDGTEIERCMKLVHAINFIRSQGFGDNLIGFPPDLDRMLDRAIQKHIDDYNHPKI